MVKMRYLVGILLGLAGLVLLGGCEHGLFPEGTPRSPYDRYMTLRGEYKPPVELDAYGRERPALRQRLQPLD